MVPTCEFAMIAITLCRKPMIGSMLKNLQHYPTGGINIDGCRVLTDDPPYRHPMEAWDHLRQPFETMRTGTMKPRRYYAEELAVANNWMPNRRDQSGQSTGIDPAVAAASAERLATLGRWPCNVVASCEPPYEGMKRVDNVP